VIAVPGASQEPVPGEDESAFVQNQAPDANPDREGRGAGPGGAVPGQRLPEPPRPEARRSEPSRSEPSRRDPSRAAIGVLADRIAAALVHHEPGWRLPRHTALARRYNVSTAEIDAAVDDLAARHLIRRLPDGQLYRVSPAEYLIPIEGVPGLASYADPMGGEIVCRSRQASWRQVPEDIGWALRIPPADPVGVIRVQWTSNGEPAAFATTYLLKEMAGPFISAQGTGSAAGLTPLPITAPPSQPDPEHGDLAPVGTPRAVHVEMQPPPPSVARSLRLSAGEPAAIVTVRFDDPAEGRPVALTVAVFRPDMFRIVVDSGERPLADGDEGSLPGAWTHAAEDWEP
jgi:DNA-binding GntR family transcriptional regulator